MIISNNLIRKLSIAVLFSATTYFSAVNAMECKSANTSPSISILLLIDEAFQSAIKDTVYPGYFPKELPRIIFFNMLELHSEKLFDDVLDYLQTQMQMSPEKRAAFKASHLSDLLNKVLQASQDTKGFSAQTGSGEIFKTFAHFYCCFDLNVWLDHEQLCKDTRGYRTDLSSKHFKSIKNHYGESNSAEIIGDMLCFAAKHGHPEIAKTCLDISSPCENIVSTVPANFLLSHVANALPLAIEGGLNSQNIVTEIFNFAGNFPSRYKRNFYGELNLGKEAKPLHKAIEFALKNKTFQNIKTILAFANVCCGLAWVAILDLNENRKTALEVVIAHEKECESENEKIAWMEIINLMRSYKPKKPKKKSRSNCLIQ